MEYLTLYFDMDSNKAKKPFQIEMNIEHFVFGQWKHVPRVERLPAALELMLKLAHDTQV